MKLDPTIAYKKSLVNPEDKKKYAEFWDRYEAKKQEEELKKACPVDPQEALDCDSCQ